MSGKTNSPSEALTEKSRMVYSVLLSYGLEYRLPFYIVFPFVNLFMFFCIFGVHWPY